MNTWFFLVGLGIVDVVYVLTAVAGRFATVCEENSVFVRLHQLVAYAFLALLVVYVVLIEIHVRAIGGSVLGPLFYVHMFLAVPLFVVSILLVYPFNGKKSRRHRTLAYTSMVFMGGVNITGIPLVLSRF